MAKQPNRAERRKSLQEAYRLKRETRDTAPAVVDPPPNDMQPPESTPITPDVPTQPKDHKKELGIEFLLAVLLALGPFGYTMLELPNSALVGLVSWSVCLAVLARIVWVIAERTAWVWRLVAALVIPLVIVAMSWRPLYNHLKRIESRQNPIGVDSTKAASRTVSPPLTEEQIEAAVKKALPPPAAAAKLTSATAFSVDIEAKVVPFEKYITGWWVRHGPNLYAANLVIFLRITNIQNVRAMISRYSVDEYERPNHQCAIQMLETITGRVFYVPPKGSVPVVGRTIQFPADNTGSYLVNFRPDDADMAHAAAVNSNNMDAMLSSRHIEPQESIRGWSFFQCRCFFPQILIIHLTDVLGHEFSYKIEHSNKMRTGDTMMRAMTTEALVDLSDSVKKIFLEP